MVAGRLSARTPSHTYLQTRRNLHLPSEFHAAPTSPFLHRYPPRDYPRQRLLGLTEAPDRAAFRLLDMVYALQAPRE